MKIYTKTIGKIKYYLATGTLKEFMKYKNVDRHKLLKIPSKVIIYGTSEEHFKEEMKKERALKQERSILARCERSVK